ncbi:class I SAM-dependent methyltransferase [Methyloceanibacter sp.]|uniref:class I SAM-dependent methyltransferase n=1 Tax=Methyloceanibacter sp. TaxID=1965321 RepID=UPI003D6D35EC
MHDTEKVSKHWGKRRTGVHSRNHWLNHPLTRAHLCTRISGDPKKGSLDHWIHDYIPKPIESALSVGCGFGAFERSLIKNNVTQHVLGIDLSRDAIAAAEAAAEAEGLSDRITYRSLDLNSYELPEAGYDAIFGISSFHHIFALESVFCNCRQALKPNGLMFLDEYIGPSRWQLSETAFETMNAILAILPERYRQRLETDPILTKQQIDPPPISWFEENDPSESIRSSEIMNVLKLYFDVLDFRGYGGGLTHLLLSGIAANFDENNQDHACILRLILLLEDTLERHGIITGDFAAIVARPKTSASRRENSSIRKIESSTNGRYA